MALLTLGTLLFLATASHAQQCYFPDGSRVDQYAPCGSNSQHCCFDAGPSWHDACFSNGLCLSWQNGYTYRGACTDANWAEDCAQMCKDSMCLFFKSMFSR